MRIYLEGKFFEIKAENVDIALVTARLPDCAKQTGLSNEDIGKFFSKITVIIDYNLYNIYLKQFPQYTPEAFEATKPFLKKRNLKLETIFF